MPPFDATLLEDPEFNNLSPQAQRIVVDDELAQDEEFQALSPEAQGLARDNFFRGLKPIPKPSDKVKAFAAKAASSIPGGVAEVPGSVVTLPNLAEDLTRGAARFLFPDADITETPPDPLEEGFDQFKEGLKSTINDPLGISEEEVNQMVRDAQLGSLGETGADILGEILGGLGVGFGASKAKKVIPGLSSGKATESVMSVVEKKKGDTVVKRNDIAAPEIVPAPEGSFERTMEDMARMNQLGIPDAPFDSPIFDMDSTGRFAFEPKVGKVKRRTRLAGLDALSVIDTIPGLKGAGSRLRKIKEEWERRTSISFNEIDKSLELIWGKRKVTGGSVKQLNPFRAQGMEKRYHITKDEVKNLVDHLYSQGRVAPINEKVEQTARLFFEFGTQPRNQRAIEMKIPIRVWNEAKKEFDEIPRTTNNPFMPHVPIDPKARDSINAQFFRRAYLAARKNDPSLTPSIFARRLAGFTEEKRDLRRFRGLEAERTFNAEAAGNGSAFEGLKEFGYETDPLRALVHYMASADRRIVQGENEDIFTAIREVADQSGDKNTSWFVNEAINRMNGHNVELTDQMTTDFLGKLRSINTATLLQAATLSNLNQLNFAANKFGLVNTLRSATGLGPLKGVNPDHARASGALFNTMIQEFTQPSHTFSKWAMAQLYANGFTASERWMRTVAAHAGAASADQLSKRLLKAYAKDPQGKKFRGLSVQMKAHGIEPDSVIAQNGLTEDDLLQAAQRFANESIGRQDITGVPLGLTNENKYWKTVLQFKQFAFTNLAEMNRQLRSQPTWPKFFAKLGGLLGGGQLTGEITRDLQSALVSFQPPTNENRVPRLLRRQFGNTVGRIVDNQIAGLASIYGIATMAWLAGQQAVQSEFLGPTVGGSIELLYKTVDPIVRDPSAEGIRKSLGAVGTELSRRVPIAGPQIRNFLREESTPGLRKLQLPELGGIPNLPNIGR